MKRVYWEDLEPGMVIARTVVGLDGRSLLTENTRITESYIHKLHNLGIRSIYIKDGLADIEFPEVISEQVLSSVSTTLETSLKSLTRRSILDITSLKKSVSMLIEDVMSNRHLLIQMEDIRAYDDYLFFHSINVAVFSIMTGLTIGYPESKLMDIGLGALLHDIGMIMVDPRITKKQGPLTPSEREQIKSHTEVGFNILRTYREVSTTAAHIAYQHHERISGNGYPRQLEGKQIFEYAKVVAVADTFDAVVSDRPFRNGYSNEQATKILRKLANVYLDPEIVEALAYNIATYPIGSVLLLNTGHLAVVTSANKTNSLRPLVHIISDQNGNLLPTALKVDLQKINKISIARRINREELEQVRAKIKLGRQMKADFGFCGGSSR